MIYYIRETDMKGHTAGSKAPKDIELICEKMKYKKIDFPHRNKINVSIYERIINIGNCIKSWKLTMKKLKEGDTIICQYPMANVFLLYFALPILKKKRIKTIVFIHDLNSIREKGKVNNYKLHYYRKCEEYLKKFDFVICHNNTMKEILIEERFNISKIIVLKIFDYLCEDNGREKEELFERSIAFAGNLSEQKSAFIYKLKKIKYNLNLYGINYENSMEIKNIIYHGSFEPEELPMKLKGSFGLIWDGDDCETCSGSVGEYLRINNPHKLSLYLASNMPVIAWDESAVAPLIRENNLGCLVHSLNEIDTIFDKLSKKEYLEMKKNVYEMGRKLRAGFFTEKALEQCKS